MTQPLTLIEVRQKLVLACQAEYDRRISNGVHPYAIASYDFNSTFDNELEKYIDVSNWKAANWLELMRALPEDPDASNSEGQWAVGAICNSNQAWATPGFEEAYRWHSIWGG
jgi:hypothetical protein